VQQVPNLTLARDRGDLASIGIATVIEDAAGVRIAKKQP